MIVQKQRKQINNNKCLLYKRPNYRCTLHTNTMTHGFAPRLDQVAPPKARLGEPIRIGHSHVSASTNPYAAAPGVKYNKSPKTST